MHRWPREKKRTSLSDPIKANEKLICNFCHNLITKMLCNYSHNNSLIRVSYPARKESRVRRPGASEFCDRASEFCA